GDLGLEQVGGHEGRQMERDKEWPDIEWAGGRSGETPNVAADPRAVKRSRQQPDDDREPAALVAAYGEIGALVDAARIRDRRAILAILHPALRHRLAFELVASDGAVRCERGGDIQYHRRLLAAWDRHRDRIGAEQGLAAAPRRHVVYARGRAVDSDHAVLERDGGIDRAGAGMIGAARTDPADAG